MKAILIVNTHGDDKHGDSLEVRIVPENDIDALLVRHFDCVTPTFSLDSRGWLTADLRMRHNRD